MTTTSTIEVLNDLIEINYDRIEGYRKAAEESKEFDESLHPYFQSKADESRKHVSALVERVRLLGGEAERGSTTMGKIYRAWMDVKATFSGNDRKTMIESCEYGEDQALKAYDNALADDPDMDPDTRQMIALQKTTIQRSHDEIKSMRDAGK
jgi:uncharacterized protein (TIGR02284 family)